MTKRNIDTEAAAAKRRRIEEQADVIAALLDTDPEEIMFDPKYGVTLTPKQADALIAIALARKGARS